MAYVLVVDDEAPVRDVLRRRLMTWGHEVATVNSAEAALAEMAEKPADIVLCDVIMPIHDGLWLLAKLRERWPDTVVIMVTGSHEPQTVVGARAYGAVDYVTKPIGREMLHQALERAMAVIASRKDPA